MTPKRNYTFIRNARRAFLSFRNNRRQGLSGLLLVLVAPLALATMGCDLQEPEIDDLVDDNQQRINQIALLHCDCWEDYGFDSQQDCFSDKALLPARKRCEAEAYSRSTDASAEYLNCINPLLHERVACINQNLKCEAKATSIQLCEEDFETGRESCIQVSRAVERALVQCR